MKRSQLKMVKARIKAEWGDTCSDHDAECPVCNAWDYYYQLRAKVDNVPLERS